MIIRSETQPQKEYFVLRVFNFPLFEDENSQKAERKISLSIVSFEEELLLISSSYTDPSSYPYIVPQSQRKILQI